MSLQNSSEMSTAPDSSTSLIQRIDDSEYPGYLNYLEEDDDEEMMGSDDEMYEDDYDDEDAESDAELEDAIAQSPTQPTTSVQPSPDVKNQKDKDEQVEQNQVDMRKQILLIQQNIKMTPQEKAKKIQELMTSKWSSRDKGKATRAAIASNKLEDKRQDFNVILHSDRQITYHEKTSNVIGCKHYQRSAKLQAHCCGKWYTCRFCHDEVSDHNIIRNLITTMMCMHCSTVQAAGQDCINPDCGKRVSRYYCKECKLWDDDPRKNIYHCYDCGICRIGKGLGQDYFHCKKCNVCMAISLKGRHKCIERNLESDCPICGEYMFTSTTTVIFMPCGHCIHYKCHQEYIQTSYQCPTCFKSLANMTEYFKRIDAMLAQHQMPPEYNKTQTFIYCNDCEKKCYAKFHFLYHKCIHCKGYNTKVLQTMEVTDGTTVEENNAKLMARSATEDLKETVPVACCPTSIGHAHTHTQQGHGSGHPNLLQNQTSSASLHPTTLANTMSAFSTSNASLHTALSTQTSFASLPHLYTASSGQQNPVPILGHTSYGGNTASLPRGQMMAPHHHFPHSSMVHQYIHAPPLLPENRPTSGFALLGESQANDISYDPSQAQDHSNGGSGSSVSYGQPN